MCTLNFGAHPQGIETFDIVLGVVTMQDVIMTLGPPSERFFKEDSRLSIHNPLDSDQTGALIVLSFMPSC